MFRFASDAGSAVTPIYLLSIVTESAVIRGILTAINWVSGSAPGHKRVAHSSFAQACAWAEAERHESLPVLAELLAKARSF